MFKEKMASVTYWTIGMRATLLILLQLCWIIHPVEALNCYYCAWMDSTEGVELDSLKGATKDVCRPENFLPNVVHKTECRNGCITTALHEAGNCSSLEVIYNSFTPTNVAKEPVPETRANVNLFPPLPPTFFHRGCSNNHTTNKMVNGCEFVQFKNGCQQRICYCTTDLCNGEIKSEAPKLFPRFPNFQASITRIVQMFFIIVMR